MDISSSLEAGELVKCLREMRGASRKELSEESGIPLRTVYAIEGGELNNLSLDRLVALLGALGAKLSVRIPDDEPDGSDNTNALVEQAARGTAGDDDPWGIWS